MNPMLQTIIFLLFCFYVLPVCFAYGQDLGTRESMS